MDYSDYNDYELLDFIYEGNEEANNIILEKYDPLISSIATKMLKYCKNSGLEYNDLRQEGFIGLNYAISHFAEEKNTVFYTYVKKCIERKIISTVIGATRLKHKALNDAMSFDADDKILDRKFKSESSNPSLIVENAELEEEIIKKVKKRLTNLEEQVFELMINDFNYKEIADILDKDSKAIDNAIQRIRVKVKDVMKDIINR